MVDDPHRWPTQSTPLSAIALLPKTASVQQGPPHTNNLIKSKELKAKKKSLYSNTKELYRSVQVHF